jgi:hypothetical protein
MRVKQLMDTLSKHNAEDEVYIEGYEGGVDEVYSVHKVCVAANINTEWYYGKHEVIEKDGEKMNDNLKGNFEILQGVLLQSRYNLKPIGNINEK